MVVIEVSTAEYAKNAFLFSYDVVRDEYKRPNDGEKTTSGWTKLAYEQVDMKRNVENDHRMAYLSRNDGKASGKVCWRVQHNGQKIKSVDVQLTGIAMFPQHAGHANHRVQGTLICGTRREAIPESGKLAMVGVGHADFTEVIVELSGGITNAGDWQHSQIFRTPLGSPNAENLLLRVQFEESGGLVSVIDNPPVPCEIEFVQHGFGKGFSPPKRIRIVGVPQNKALKQFCINLVTDGTTCKDGNVLFHLNPRFAQNQVVRNHWMVGNGWQNEDTDGAFPFTMDKQFVLDLIAEPGNKIKCMVDDQYMCTFGREDLAPVSRLEISESVQIKSVTLQSSACVNLTNVTVPADIKFANYGITGGFVAPRSIRIVGVPQDKGSRLIGVNLVTEGKTCVDGDVLFHFNPRFNQGMIVRNHWLKGKGWQTEQRDGGLPLTMGKQFVLDMIAEPGNKIKCLIDDKFFCDFSSGEDNGRIVKLEITDSVEVKSVTIN